MCSKGRAASVRPAFERQYEGIRGLTRDPMERNRRPPRLSLLLGAAAFLAMAGWLALAGSVQGAPNSVRIQPATVTVGPGGSVAGSLAARAPPGRAARGAGDS